MNLIVAVDNGWGIGNKGELLARVSADLRNFRSLTQGKVVIYGYNTLATFPKGRALKNRTNILLTRKKDFTAEDIIVAGGIEELLEIVKSYNSDDVFVIGGESIYRQLLEYCDRAYVTKFAADFEKDAYMPSLDGNSEWQCVDVGETMYSNIETDSIDGMEYRFLIYERIPKKV